MLCCKQFPQVFLKKCYSVLLIQIHHLNSLKYGNIEMKHLQGIRLFFQLLYCYMLYVNAYINFILKLLSFLW